MMAAPLTREDVLVSIGVDDRGLRVGMDRAGRSIEQFAKKSEKQIAGLQKGVSGLNNVVVAFGANAGSSLGALNTALGGISAVLSGGLVAAAGIGFGALVAGIAQAVRESREAQEHMAALARETGVTADQVDKLQRAFARAGVELKRIEAQRLAQLAHEAGLSADEAGRLAEKIQQLATLQGTDITSAARQVIQAHTQALREVEDLTKRILEQEELRASGVSSEMFRLGQLSEELHKKRAEAAKELARIEADAAQAAVEAARYRQLAEQSAANTVRRAWEHNAQVQEERFRELSGRAAEYRAEIESIDRAFRLAGQAGAALMRMLQEEQEKSRKAAEAEALARARAREAARIETEILAATVARDEEAASVWRLTQALAALEERRRQGLISAQDAARQAQLLTQQHREAVDAIARQMVYQVEDAILQTRMMEAELTDNAIEQARIRGEIRAQEIRRRLQEEERAIEQLRERMESADEQERERLQRMLDYRVQIAEEMRKQLEIAERQTLADVEKVEREITIKRENERQKRIEAQKRMQEQLRREAEQEEMAAVQAGANIANAFVRGMRSVFDSEDFRSVLSAILSIVGAVVSIAPGGQAAGFGLQALASLIAGFSEGGQVSGPGTSTSDSILVRVSDGEFITRASSVRKFGVDFFESLNEGILDVSKIPGYARGGLVGQAPSASGGMTGPVQVYIQAFDPRSTEEALARIWEPAQYRRGVSRQDSKTMAMLRRRLAPRAGA